MRVKRLKHVKKLINYYKTTFGFREPHQFLVDLTFCQFALMYKVNIKEQLPKLIEAELQLYTTSCILHEGAQLGPQLHGALLVCKQFKLRKCSHHKNPVSARECIKSLIGTENEHHLFVASQDLELRKELRTIPGVPLLHIHYNALVLEKHSKETLEYGNKVAYNKVNPSEYEKDKIIKMKQEKNITDNDKRSHKRRKIKGVNPLAMLKKKNSSNHQPVRIEKTKKRQRKRKNIPQHVLQELMTHEKT